MRIKITKKAKTLNIDFMLLPFSFIKIQHAYHTKISKGSLIVCFDRYHEIDRLQLSTTMTTSND